MILDWFYPRRCPVCDEPVNPYGKLFCDRCRATLRYVEEPRCFKCGKRLQREEDEYCHDCSSRPHFYTRGFGLYEYESVRKSLYRFKYDGRQEYAESYGEDLVNHLRQEILAMRADALVPVPLHRARLRERGYNQAEVLARAIGKRLSIRVDSDLIIRQKSTIPQKKLDNSERQNNVKNAFIINKNDVKYNNIIVVDDIYTTGSTIDAVARILLRAGAAQVYFLTLAVGNGL